MKTEVKDLTIIELQDLISDTVRASIHSIKEARKDYKKM